MLKTSIRTAILIPVALASAIGLGACGSSYDDNAKDVQKQGVEIQKQAKDIQADAKKGTEDIKAGRKTADEVNAELKKKTDKVQKDVTDVENDVIDQVQKDSRIPDEAKKQLEDAQEQLNATP